MPNIDPDPEAQLTLDDTVIEQLSSDMGEDAGMVIESYIESIDEFLHDIENRTVRTPGEDLHRWAHTVKSSAASIGAMRLAHLAAHMESAYRDHLPVDVEQQLNLMQREFQQVQTCIGSMSDSLQQGTGTD